MVPFSALAIGQEFKFPATGVNAKKVSDECALVYGGNFAFTTKVFPSESTSPVEICPDCGAPLYIDTKAETELQIWRRGSPGVMPHVETLLRPCTVTFCSGCEFAVEVRS